MACGIGPREPGGLLLLVWDLPWERMTRGTGDLLAVLGQLLEGRVLRNRGGG
jgi:hypothetical protein